MLHDLLWMGLGVLLGATAIILLGMYSACPSDFNEEPWLGAGTDCYIQERKP